MKKLMGLILVTTLATSTVGCAYSPGGVTADNKVVIVKNIGFLFGILNKIFVCNVTPGGLAGCAAGEAP